jgi:hypothetical protein
MKCPVQGKIQQNRMCATSAGQGGKYAADVRFQAEKKEVGEVLRGTQSDASRQTRCSVYGFFVA